MTYQTYKCTFGSFGIQRKMPQYYYKDERKKKGVGLWMF